MSVAPESTTPPEPHVHGVFASSPPEPPPVPGARPRLKDHLVWPAIALFIICAITTAALGATNALTLEPIAQQLALAKNEARQAALSATTFDAVDLNALKAADETAYAEVLGTGKRSFIEASYGKDADGKTTGLVVLVDTRGYADGLQIMVGIAADGTVSGIRILADSETPGLGKKIRDDAFLAGLLGKSTASGFAVAKQATGDVVPVDAVTGATISSKAVIDAVNAAARLSALLQKGGA
jgi:electron transport complex protein RnfG